MQTADGHLRDEKRPYRCLVRIVQILRLPLLKESLPCRFFFFAKSDGKVPTTLLT